MLRIAYEYKGQIREFEVDFQYGRFPETNRPDGTTFAAMYIPGDERPVYTATAYTHPTDNFDKKKGRKLAFGRLLQHCPDKQERQMIWDAFFGRNKNGGWK